MRDEKEAKIFSRNIRKYIDASGKSQKEVADDLGIAQTTFNTWCVGKIMPSAGKVQLIADYFGVMKSALTDEIPEKMMPLPVIKKDELKMIQAFRVAPQQTRDAILILLNLRKG